MSRTTAREVAMMLQFSSMLGGEDTPEHVLAKADDIGTLDQDDLPATPFRGVIACSSSKSRV